MTTRTTAPRAFNKHKEDEPSYGFIFDDVLPSGVTISSVAAPIITTVSGSSTTALSVTGQAANAAAVDDDDGLSVAIGRAARATVTGGTSGCVYNVMIEVTCSNGEHYGGDWRVSVEG